MTADDIIAALEGLRALVRDPVTGTYALRLDYDYFRSYIELWEAKKYVRLNPEALVWTPYIMGRSNLAHFESAPPLATVAPREDEGEDDEENDNEAVVAEDARMAVKSEAHGHGSLVNGNTPADQQTEAFPRLPDTLLTPSQEIDRQLGLDNGGHVSAKSPLRHESPHPDSQTPAATNGEVIVANSATPPVPPARFEIFPPLPGTSTSTVKRRPGARFGSTRRRTSTPFGGSARRPRATARDRSTPTGKGKGKGKGKTLFKRATRSKLTESMEAGENGHDDDDDDDDGDDDDSRRDTKEQAADSGDGSAAPPVEQDEESIADAADAEGEEEE